MSEISAFTEQQDQQSELERRGRALRALNSISELTLNSQKLEDAYAQIVEEVSAATGFPIVAIEFYDAERQVMVFAATKNIPLPENQVLQVPVAETLSGTVSRTGRAIVKVYEPDEAKNCDDNETLNRLGIKTFVCVPLTVKNQTIGVLSLAHSEIVPPDEYLLPFASNLASHIAALTECKRTESSLRASETDQRQLANQQSSILNALPAHIALLANDGTIITVNEVWQRFSIANSVYAVDLSIGSNYLEICERADGECSMEARMVADGIRSVLNGEREQFEMEYPCHSPTEQRWFRLMVTPLRTGAATGAVVMHINVTERRRVEEHLRLLESAVRQSNDPVVITTPNLDLPGPTVVFVNPAFTSVTGYSPAEIIGQTPRILQGAKTERAVLDEMRRCLSDERDFRGETVNYHKDGTEMWMEWHISPLRDVSGTLTHFVSVQQDITERKRTEQQLQQAQKMEAIGRLAGGVAHDFNNMLTVISGYSELMLRRLKEEDPLQRNVVEIKRAAERAAELTRQLLAFSRKQVQQLQILNLNNVVIELNRMLERLIGEDIVLSVLPNSDSGQVRADVAQIEQIIMNLVVNARDAMPNGGSIIIETKNAELSDEYARAHAGANPGSYVLLTVTDTGQGMDAETQARVFEPFFTTKEAGKGTGLGLSTVYGIVKQNEGYVTVRSQVGRGTVFEVYLPRVGDAPPKKEIANVVAPAERGTETILLVEDEDNVRALTKQVLELSGYNVLEAANGKYALLLCGQYQDRIDLLLTDVVMPEMSGPKLVEQLVELRPKISVLYMSGYTGNDIINHAISTDAVNFIKKPYSTDTLASKVREILDAARQ